MVASVRYLHRLLIVVLRAEHDLQRVEAVRVFCTVEWEPSSVMT